MTRGNSRAVRRFLRASLLLCVGALLVGCNISVGDLTGGTAPATRPSVSSRPAAATAPPHWSSHPIASASPLPPATGKPTAFAAFRRHLNRSIDVAKPIFAKMDGLDHAGTAKMKRVVGDGSDWANGELEWLTVHAPRDCYAGFYNDWRSAVAILAEGFGIVMNGLETEDDDEAFRGIALLDTVPDFRQPGTLSPISCGQ